VTWTVEQQYSLHLTFHDQVGPRVARQCFHDALYADGFLEVVFVHQHRNDIQSSKLHDNNGNKADKFAEPLLTWATAVTRAFLDSVRNFASGRFKGKTRPVQTAPLFSHLRSCNIPRRNSVNIDYFPYIDSKGKHMYWKEAIDTTAPSSYCVTHHSKQGSSLACRARRNSTTLANLHWLRTAERIKFKLTTLTFRWLQGSAPRYLSADFIWVADVTSRRRLR